MRDIELVIELNEKESRNFIEEYLNPKPNPARDKMIEGVRRIYTEKPRRNKMCDVKIKATIKGEMDGHDEKQLEIIEAELKLACAKTGLTLEFNTCHSYELGYEDYLD